MVLSINKMAEKRLTIGYIEKNDKRLRLNITNNQFLQKGQFLLVIQANNKDFSRIMIYPINVNKIMKITISSLKEITEDLKLFSSILKKFNIIHNSGLTVRRDLFIIEIYLNLRFSDSKYKVLKISLDKIKNEYIDIDIEEISLNN